MKNSVFITFGSLIYALNQWLILWAISVNHDVSYVGDYLLSIAILTPIALLVNFGSRNSILAERLSVISFSTFYYSQKTMGLLFLLAMIFAVLIDVNSWIFISVLISKYAWARSELFIALFLKTKQAKKVFISHLLKLMMTIALLLIVFLSKFEIVFEPIAYGLSVIFIHHVYEKKVGAIKLVRRVGKLSLIKMRVGKSMPLAVAAVVNASSNSFPKILLGVLISKELLAYFGILYYFITLSIIPINSFAQLTIVKLSDSSGSQRYLLIKYLLFSFVCALFFYILIEFSSDFVLTNIYSIEYSPEQLTLLLISLLMFVTTYGSLVMAANTARKSYRAVMGSVLIGALFCIIVAFPLIVNFEMNGAIISIVTLVSVTALVNTIKFNRSV